MDSLTTRPQTLMIHLLHGKPEGVKILEIQNKTLRMYIVPRQYLSSIKERSDLLQPAIYFLISDNQENLYIGEAENSYKRINQHDSKEQWDIALICISINNALDKASVKYLESSFINIVSQIDNIKLSNVNKPDLNSLHEFKISEIKEFQEYIELAIISLGYNFVHKINRNDLDQRINSDEIWYIKARNSEAKGIFVGSSFTILKGALINGLSTPNFRDRYPHTQLKRMQILESKCIPIDNNMYQSKEDINFASINQATSFVIGQGVNSWFYLKNREGKTIDEVNRSEKRVI
jgi:hypothetical protein